MSTAATVLADLRRAMRARRAALPPPEQRRAARALAARLRQLPAVRAARRIAGYAAVRGELDPALALAAAARRGAQIYLPVVVGAHLRFVRYRPGERLTRGPWGIPAPARRRPPWPVGRMQVVLAPVIAVTDRGDRLGSGGGYYDRAIARRNPPRAASGPLVIGIAHDFQRVPSLPRAAHDVPVDLIATPAGVTRCASDAHRARATTRARDARN